MRIAGAARQASSTTDSLSPADTRVVVARVRQRHRGRRRRRGRRGARRLPGLEPHALDRARAADRTCGRHHPRAALRAVGLADLGDGQEPRRGAGRDRGDRRSPHLLRRSRCARTAASCARWTSWRRPTATQRAAAVRRLGGDRALELSLRAHGRARGGGAADRQHRRDEAVVGDAAVGAQAVRDLRGGGPAARDHQLRHRRRSHRRRRRWSCTPTSTA